MTASAYALVDCGGGRRLERFAGVLVDRPAPAAPFPPALPAERWREAALSFHRERGWRGTPPEDWRVSFGPAALLLRPAAGGQLGVFPEHAAVCDRLDALLDAAARPGRELRALNLFAHTGLVTLRLAARPEVAEVVHVDAGGGAVRQARDNARVSGLGEARIRWLVDDAMTFVNREIRRGSRYDVVVADPPAFGRGGKGAEWKLERDLPGLLAAAGKVLAAGGGIVCVSCHREGWREGDVLELVRRSLPGGRYEGLSLALRAEAGERELPAGFAAVRM